MKDTKDKIDKKIFVIIGIGLAYILIGLSFLMDNVPLNSTRLFAGFLVLFTGVGFLLWTVFNIKKYKVLRN